MSLENYRQGQTDEEREQSIKRKEELLARIKERGEEKERREHKVFYGDEEGVLRTERPEPEWKELLKPKITKGALVQWTNQGVDQWGEPKIIVSISSDGEYAFFEGSMTGVPVSQLEIVK